MYNLVLFVSDLSLIKKMGNIVFNNFKSMNLIGIVSTHKELESLCKKHKVNLIILSETKYNSKPINCILPKIDSVIVLCESDTSNYTKDPNTLFLSINKSTTYMINELSKFNNSIYNQFIKNKLIYILENLKFDFKFSGTTYFLDAVIISYLTMENYEFENLKKYIYPLVSQKHNTDLSIVKSSIFRAIQSAKKHLKPEDFQKLNMNYPEKITTKHLITEIINHL